MEIYHKDGSQDKRFNANYQLPVVQCGLLKVIRSGNLIFELMTSNSESPFKFVGLAQNLFSVSATLPQ